MMIRKGRGGAGAVVSCMFLDLILSVSREFGQVCCRVCFDDGMVVEER